jgi:hypothetical protein
METCLSACFVFVAPYSQQSTQFLSSLKINNVTLLPPLSKVMIVKRLKRVHALHLHSTHVFQRKNAWSEQNENGFYSRVITIKHERSANLEII